MVSGAAVVVGVAVVIAGAAVVAGAVAGAAVVSGAAVVVADKSFVLCLFRELFFDSFNLFLFCLAEVVGAVTDGAVVLIDEAAVFAESAVVDGAAVIDGALCLPSCLLG